MGQLIRSQQSAFPYSVMFDLDGVLFDSHPLHIRNWQQILREEGRCVTENELEFLYDGARREEILRRFLGELSEEENTRLARRKDELFQQLESHLQMTPGLTEFLQALEDSGARLAVVTSASRPRVYRLLDRFQLTSRFSVIITAGDWPTGKEDPTIFREALGRLGAVPSNCLLIEDSAKAIATARAIGIRCVGFGSEHRRRTLSDAGADLVKSNFSELDFEGVVAQLISAT
jgi:beta-phosphoglucomutase